MPVTHRLHLFAAAVAGASSLAFAAPSPVQILQIAVATDITSMVPYFLKPSVPVHDLGHAVGRAVHAAHRPIHTPSPLHAGQGVK